LGKKLLFSGLFTPFNPFTMAYNEQLADRLREALAHLPNMVEKPMMGGLTFMYNDKMCLGIMKDELLCRIDPALMETVLEKQGCHQMDFTGRPMKGFVLVDKTGMGKKSEFDYWVNLCLDFNSRAKSSKRKK
jgi:TfoX/Sxy family transcriptional regulator of competence genes